MIHPKFFLHFLGLALTASPALAQAPQPWELGLQAAASPVMERISSLNGYLTYLIIGIVLLVVGLLAFVVIRFGESRHPVPATFSHNTKLEVLWTVVPVLILFAVAVPSFKLLYYMDRTQDAEMTLKVTGHQWFWSYSYPDHAPVGMDSFIVYEDSLKPGQKRLLEVDNRVVLPVDTTIRVIVTADDVIHSWAVPALGLKTDAVPGRLNETWVRISKPGTYYGQCSELCGANHSFMPIAIDAVSKQEFQAWIDQARQKHAQAK